MPAHKFVDDIEGKDDCCQQCGARYHCAVCNEGSSMMGHWNRDKQGDFQRCKYPERYQQLIELKRFEAEQKERAELERLKKKYEPET